jgi:hypothetical protein
MPVDLRPMTIADTDAQGFSKEITFPRERWVGYIKDYDSANLMMVGPNPLEVSRKLNFGCSVK